MKRLIMCEGSNELEVVRLLLENDAYNSRGLDGRF